MTRGARNLLLIAAVSLVLTGCMWKKSNRSRRG